MSQKFVPAVFMRGGSSKGVIFHARDLPDEQGARDKLFLDVLGTPDPYGRQLNGMGGGISSLSKVAIIGPPTHPDADARLYERGTIVLPDILANAGGVTVSYFEWVQGLDNFFWDQKRVQDELQKVMEKAFDEVNAKADEADCDYRTAAYTIAISRVAEACRLKGLFP